MQACLLRSKVGLPIFALQALGVEHHCVGDPVSNSRMPLFRSGQQIAMQTGSGGFQLGASSKEHLDGWDEDCVLVPGKLDGGCA